MKPETVRRRSPLSWVPTVYFAMGLPFILVNMVSTLMFRGLGIDDARIALWTSLIILPWSLKPIWSPLMEMFRTKKFWVVSTQLISGLGLALTALTLPLPDFFPYAVALMGVIAFSGATHDIATDGVYITELSKDQQARFIGWQGAFYNIAKVFAMGGLVYLAGALKERVGIVEAWMIVMALCGALLFLLGIYHLRMLPSGGEATAHAGSVGEALRETGAIFRGFFRKRYIGIYIAFIVFYRFAEGLVIKIVPLFLNAPLDNQGLGLTEQQIGLYYGTFGVIAFVVGSILGGYFIAWLKLRRALFPLITIFNIPFVVYALLAWFQPASPLLICGGIVFEYFSYALHHAAGGARTAQNGPLRLRFVAGQSGRDAAGHGERLALRPGRLPPLLPLGPHGHHPHIPHRLAHPLRPSGHGGGSGPGRGKGTDRRINHR